MNQLNKIHYIHAKWAQVNVFLIVAARLH